MPKGARKSNWPWGYVGVFILCGRRRRSDDGLDQLRFGADNIIGRTRLRLPEYLWRRDHGDQKKVHEKKR
jgi:hypothetical protein